MQDGWVRDTDFWKQRDHFGGSLIEDQMWSEIRSGLGVMAVEMGRKLKGLVTNCHWEGEWS